MAKRGPQSDLNDRNWDDEDEPEEAGLFVQAKESVLKDRVIKKGRRRLMQGTGATAVSSGAFSSFAGFGMKPASTCIPTGIGATSSHSLFTSGLSPGNQTSNAASADSSPFGAKVPQVDAVKTPSENGGGESDSTYLQNLKKLNEGFLNWIKMHVEKNPYIELTPVLKDYSDHLNRIEQDLAKRREQKSKKEEGQKKEEEKEKSVSKTVSEPPAASATTESASVFKPLGGSGGQGFSFTTSSSLPASKPGLLSSSSSTASPFSGFNFSKQPSDLKPGFSFASGPADSKASTSSGTDNTDAAGGDDDEYVPPKPEVKEIVEEGAVYTRRCKLFYQRGGAWKERGLGNVYVKALDGGKTQLLVRADNTLGTILLNIMLSKTLPLKKQGKNNVFLVCNPNPKIDDKDSDTEPVPMLIRVKTEEDADEMLSKIEEQLK